MVTSLVSFSVGNINFSNGIVRKRILGNYQEIIVNHPTDTFVYITLWLLMIELIINSYVRHSKSRGRKEHSDFFQVGISETETRTPPFI